LVFWEGVIVASVVGVIGFGVYYLVFGGSSASSDADDIDDD